MARRDLQTPRGSVLPQHPTYTLWAPTWRTLLDVYEGAGGFMDPLKPYLVPHPREWLDHTIKTTADGTEAGDVKWTTNPRPSMPSPKLTARRNLARYENIASTLLDQIRAALFRKAPNRSFADPDAIPDENPLRMFWQDADGLGRTIDVVMQEGWMAAAVFGHAISYLDRDGETDDSTTPSQADAPPVILRWYTPLDMPDWLTDDLGQLRAVKLLEAAPRTDFSDTFATNSYQVRTIDDQKWTLEVRQQPAQRKVTAPTKTETHGFGTLPITLLYARRRALTPIVGKSALGDPQLYIDHYNLVSEVRELLRNQTFAILNIPLGDKAMGGVESEMKLIGSTMGTGNILFSTNPAGYISPEGANVEAYHEHIDRLIRTIYRLAVVNWETDSREVESAEARKLKQEDLHQMLAGYATECETTEMQLARLVYRAFYGDRWEEQWDKDEPSVAYPDDFDVASLTEMLENATAAMALELGETATKQLKKRIANEMLNGEAKPVLQAIEEEIDQMDVKTAADQEKEMLQMQLDADAEMAAKKGPPTK